MSVKDTRRAKYLFSGEKGFQFPMFRKRGKQFHGNCLSWLTKKVYLCCDLEETELTKVNITFSLNDLLFHSGKKKEMEKKSIAFYSSTNVRLLLTSVSDGVNSSILTTQRLKETVESLLIGSLRLSHFRRDSSCQLKLEHRTYITATTCIYIHIYS